MARSDAEVVLADGSTLVLYTDGLVESRHQLFDTGVARLGTALAELQGVSPDRAHQIPAGAVVAAATMRALDVPCVRICPWALREGVILRRLDSLGGA